MLKSRKLGPILLCAGFMAAMASSVFAQGALRVERQNVPPPPRGAEASLATGPQARDQENTICKGVQVYFTIRGLAFTCADFQEGTSFLMVINEGQFPGGAAAAAVLLERAAVESVDYIANPQRPGTSLKVRFREPGEWARGVCQLVTATGTSTPCREVVHFYM